MMGDSFTFYGQTTFINRPVDVVLRDFQRTYVDGAHGDAAEALEHLGQLLELVLGSRDVGGRDKEAVAGTIQSVAVELRRGGHTKRNLRQSLTSVANVVGKAADIATPAAALITATMHLLGLA